MNAYVRHQYDPLTMDKTELLKLMNFIGRPINLLDFISQDNYDNIKSNILPSLEHNSIIQQNYSFINIPYLLEMGRDKFRYMYLYEFIKAYDDKNVKSILFYLHKTKLLFIEILQAKKEKLEYLITKQKVPPKFLHYFENKETISDIEELNHILMTYIDKLDTNISILQLEIRNAIKETELLLFDTCSLDELGLCSYITDYSDVSVEKICENISKQINCCYFLD